MAKTHDNLFDLLPDEIVERILSNITENPILTEHNHVRKPANGLFFDYSIQQPFLKQSHAALMKISSVCHRFHMLIKSKHFWILLNRKDHVLSKCVELPENFDDYEKLYVCNPFHPDFNLILSDNWFKRDYSLTSIEASPAGAHKLFDQFNRLLNCLVTSYQTAIMKQSLKLSGENSGLEHITCLRPIIEFSIFVAGRWDCGCRCKIILSFSDRHQVELEKVIPQWNDKKWYKLTYRYAEYENLPESVDIELHGSDTQFWAGFYGIKFSQARVSFLIRNQNNGRNEKFEEIIEPNENEINQIEVAAESCWPRHFRIAESENLFSEQSSIEADSSEEIDAELDVDEQNADELI